MFKLSYIPALQFHLDTTALFKLSRHKFTFYLKVVDHDHKLHMPSHENGIERKSIVTTELM